MYAMFDCSKFNGDISQWDVSKAEIMTCMFARSNFNGDISKWDVSNVENMKRMFEKSAIEHLPPWYKE
jgi:surface protein